MTEWTVGETRHALAALTGMPADEIHHYAMVADMGASGLVLLFCCDDRNSIAGLLRLGADLVLGQIGQSQNGRPPPPMPEGSEVQP